jgi:hypothetical protein
MEVSNRFKSFAKVRIGVIGKQVRQAIRQESSLMRHFLRGAGIIIVDEAFLVTFGHQFSRLPLVD